MPLILRQAEINNSLMFFTMVMASGPREGTSSVLTLCLVTNFRNRFCPEINKRGMNTPRPSCFELLIQPLCLNHLFLIFWQYFYIFPFRMYFQYFSQVCGICRRFLALFLSGCWGNYRTGTAKLDCWVINSPLVFWFFGFFIIYVFTIPSSSCIFAVNELKWLIRLTVIERAKKRCKLNFGSKLETSFNFVNGQTGPGSGFWQCFRLVWRPSKLFESFIA